jgi:hypothetical protein
MERRDILRNLAIGSVGASAVAAAGPVAAKSGDTLQLKTQRTYPGVDGKMLVNKPRAYAIMEEYKIDGLIALNPINVYYLTNTITTMTKFRSDIGGLATFARDPKQPSFLITSNPQAWYVVNPSNAKSNPKR